MTLLKLSLVCFVLGGAALLVFPFGVGQALGGAFCFLFVVLLMIGLAQLEKPITWAGR